MPTHLLTKASTISLLSAILITRPSLAMIEEGVEDNGTTKPATMVTLPDVASQKPQAVDDAATASTSVLTEEDTTIKQQLIQIESELNFEGNPLGTRIKTALSNPIDRETFGGRRSQLLSEKNLKVLKSSPLLWGIPLRDQLKEIKNNLQLYLIASGADLIFKGHNTQERHDRLFCLDRASSAQLFAFLECFNNEKNKQFWKTISGRNQEEILRHLPAISVENVTIIFQNFASFHRFFEGNGREYDLILCITQMNGLSPEVLQGMFENQAVLFRPSQPPVVKPPTPYSTTYGSRPPVENPSLLTLLKEFTTKEALMAFVKQVVDNDANWFRFGTSDLIRQNRILEEMKKAPKS